MQRVRRAERRRGQSQTEFAILVVAIAVIGIATIVLFGGKIAALFGFASDEVATMGGADLSLPDSPGGGPDGSDSGDSGDDGLGDSGDGSGSGSTKGPGGSGGGGGGGSRGDSKDDDFGPTYGDQGTRFNAPGRQPRTGVYTLGEGDDEITVTAAGGSAAQGTAKAERDKAKARKQAAAREQEAQWSSKRKKSRGTTWDDEGGGSGMGLGDMMRYVLLAVLVLGALLLGRAAFAGGDGGGD